MADAFWCPSFSLWTPRYACFTDPSWDSYLDPVLLFCLSIYTWNPISQWRSLQTRVSGGLTHANHLYFRRVEGATPASAGRGTPRSGRARWTCWTRCWPPPSSWAAAARPASRSCSQSPTWAHSAGTPAGGSPTGWCSRWSVSRATARPGTPAQRPLAGQGDWLWQVSRDERPWLQINTAAAAEQGSRGSNYCLTKNWNCRSSNLCMVLFSSFTHTHTHKKKIRTPRGWYCSHVFWATFSCEWVECLLQLAWWTFVVRFVVLQLSYVVRGCPKIALASYNITSSFLFGSASEM